MMFFFHILRLSIHRPLPGVYCISTIINLFKIHCNARDYHSNDQSASAAAYTAAAEAARKDTTQATLTSCGSLGPPASAEGEPTAMDDNANVASKKHPVRACGDAVGSRLIRHSVAQRARHACVGHAVRSADSVGAP